jgi:regulatory protein
MMEKRISAILAQKRNPNRVSIELDGDFAFGLSRIVAAWLNVGDTLDETKIEELTNQDTAEVAYEKALRLLDYRPRTGQEIRKRLHDKGFDEAVIEGVIQRLSNANLVQDQQYARMWVDNRNEFHPRSQRLIRYELRNKGVSELLINNALVESASDEDLATRAAEKYARRLDRLDWSVFRKKLSAFLARRGFSFATINPVVHSVWHEIKKNRSATLDNEEDENE